MTKEQIYDDMFWLPEHYEAPKQPFYKGDGEHNTATLETICKEYSDFCHKQQIIKQKLQEKLVKIIDKSLVQSLTKGQETLQELLNESRAKAQRFHDKLQVTSTQNTILRKKSEERQTELSNKTEKLVLLEKKVILMEQLLEIEKQLK